MSAPLKDNRESNSSKPELRWISHVWAIPGGLGWGGFPTTSHFEAEISTTNANPARKERCTHKHKRFEQAKRCAEKMLAAKRGVSRESLKRDAVGQRELFK